MPISNEEDISHSQAVHMAGLIYKSREKQPLTKEEQQLLEDWLSSSETNRQLFESLNDRSLLIKELETLMKYDEEKAVSAIFNAVGEVPPSAVKNRKMMPPWLSVAASLLLLASAAWWFFIRKSKQDDQPSIAVVTNLPGDNKALLILADSTKVILDGAGTRTISMQGGVKVEQQQDRLIYTAAAGARGEYNTVQTPRGGQYRLQLADGSEVWLNAASSVTYPVSFVGNTREVTITGEAYFKVAKNKTKPFFVTANAMKVQVVGTEFNVMAYNDEDTIRTTLVEGIVKAANTKPGAQQELTLQPGEQAFLAQAADTLRIEKANMDVVIAWRKGKFFFKETNMAAIMRQIARWYNVKVEYRGAAASINFTGGLPRTEKVQEVLDILSDTRDVHFETKDDKTIVVIPGPR